MFKENCFLNYKKKLCLVIMNYSLLLFVFVLGCTTKKSSEPPPTSPGKSPLVDNTFTIYTTAVAYRSETGDSIWNTILLPNILRIIQTTNIFNRIRILHYDFRKKEEIDIDKDKIKQADMNEVLKWIPNIPVTWEFHEKQFPRQFSPPRFYIVMDMAHLIEYSRTPSITKKAPEYAGYEFSPDTPYIYLPYNYVFHGMRDYKQLKLLDINLQQGVVGLNNQILIRKTTYTDESEGVNFRFWDKYENYDKLETMIDEVWN
jgi:hypothetical protein